MDTSLADLARRIAALEARDAIVAVMHRYTRCADFGPLEDWADCFTPDGTYETVYEDGHVESRAKGREELIAVVAASRERNAGAGRHFILAPDIEVDGDTARSTALMGTFTGLPGDARLGFIGRYFDVLRRCEDGRWRFVSRRSELHGRGSEQAALAGDVVAIQATMYRYTRSADFGPPEDWVDCFMPDGVYETVLEDGRVVARGRGPAELLAVVKASNAKYTGGRHFVMAPDIQVSGDRATATSLMGTFAGVPDNARFRLIGRYEDVLQRCADGRWRFASRRSLIQGRAAEFAPELRS